MLYKYSVLVIGAITDTEYHVYGGAEKLNKTDCFLERIEDFKKQEIPTDVYQRAKLALLDYIGVTIAGLKEQQSKIDCLIEAFSDEGGKIRPIGLQNTMSMNNAVFLNGLNGHALDFDDGTNAGIIHLGSPIFSVFSSTPSDSTAGIYGSCSSGFFVLQPKSDRSIKIISAIDNIFFIVTVLPNVLLLQLHKCHTIRCGLTT